MMIYHMNALNELGYIKMPELKKPDLLNDINKLPLGIPRNAGLFIQSLILVDEFQ